MLFIEQDVDAPLGGRLDRWLAANDNPGTIYLPLVMTDSGHDISNGDESFATVYGNMIDRSLDRPATAGMAVTSSRSGSILHLEVQLDNRSGATLSAANDATLTALVWQEPVDPEAIPVVATARTAPIPSLVDGSSAKIVLEASVSALDPDRTRWVVIADYQPNGTFEAYDTLQAVTGP